MPQLQSKDNQYFLTRQTANLGADFCRELKNDAALFLLYGESRVGKTRFLNELTKTGLKNTCLHWIDFKDGAGVNGSSAITSEVDRILSIVTTHQVIVADHFELASNKLKHQILQSWSTDGIDKSFSLIIITGTQGLNDVSQLASHYRLDIKSFQLMPFSSSEVDFYCASRLFPSLLPNSLSMSKQIRRALNETEGIVGKVSIILEQEGDNISMMRTSKPLPILKPLLVIMTLVIVLVSTGLAYYFLSADTVNRQLLVSPVENNAAITQSDPGLALAFDEKAKHDGLLTKTDLFPGLLVEHENIKKSSRSSKTHDPVQLTETRKNEIETKVKSDSIESVDLKFVVEKMSYSNWFQNELKRSKYWLKSSDRSHATIQIMAIGFNNSTDDDYFKYIKKLEKKGVDALNVRVYSTQVQGKTIFSVIYGEFDSQRAATESMPDLPASLNVNQPIIRTIGGIWNEINSL